MAPPMQGPSQPPEPPGAPPTIGEGALEPMEPADTAPVDARGDGRGPPGARPPGGGGGFRQFAKLWGFLGFIVLVLVLARSAILPFVFALLMVYILAPPVRWLSSGQGVRRMPRAAAILVCYVVILAGIGLFLAGLLPRLVKDIERVGREAPALYTQLTDVWAPGVAGWIEDLFPAGDDEVATEPEAPPVIADVPLPPGTRFVITPLPDGRMAVEMREDGVELIPRSGGGYTLAPGEARGETSNAEEQLREWAREGLAGLQSQLGEVVRFGRSLVVSVIGSVWTFFLVFMIAAFILIDVGRVMGFVRSLVPAHHRTDFDSLAASMDRGLAGVIRGQLLICLVNAILTYIGLVIIGVNYAITLAAIAGVLSFIPILGAILSTVPIVFTALVSGDAGVDVSRAFLILLWIIGINFLEANLLNPKIMGTAARIHPLVVIFALLVGKTSYGLTGALLAVPVASIVQVLFLHMRDKAAREESGPAGAPPPSG
jgi:predicted PurR-regulated permease PerM